jgi:hypothetical protein
VIFLPIIERNEEIVKVKTKKKKHNLCTGYASFSCWLELKFDDYQPPNPAKAGTT